jgi:DNA-binding TFAR19-related protein (PDSD5 family)
VATYYQVQRVRKAQLRQVRRVERSLDTQIEKFERELFRLQLRKTILDQEDAARLAKFWQNVGSMAQQVEKELINLMRLMLQ